jgi:tetratricopeptide (TPR) repeat protein
VTVALDTEGPDAARPFVERAGATHPSLVDPSHQLDEHLGVVNVPSGIWVDEDGMLVRPPETAFPWRPPFLDRELPEAMDPVLRERLEEAKRIEIDHEPYLAALRDWVARGPDSTYALDADEVVERSRPRGEDEARAAACFELGQHLHRRGRPEAAVRWFREAHRLQPDNWTYKRQAWHLVDPRQGPTDAYDSDWLSDVRRVGADRYYDPPLLEAPPA